MAGVITSLIITSVTCPFSCSSPLSKSLEQAVIEEAVRVRDVYACSLFCCLCGIIRLTLNRRSVVRLK